MIGLDMEKPKSCWKCRFHSVYHDDKCFFNHKYTDDPYFSKNIYDDCPIIEIYDLPKGGAE